MSSRVAAGFLHLRPETIAGRVALQDESMGWQFAEMRVTRPRRVRPDGLSPVMRNVAVPDANVPSSRKAPVAVFGADPSIGIVTARPSHVALKSKRYEIFVASTTSSMRAD